MRVICFSTRAMDFSIHYFYYNFFLSFQLVGKRKSVEDSRVLRSSLMEDTSYNYKICNYLKPVYVRNSNLFALVLNRIRIRTIHTAISLCVPFNQILACYLYLPDDLNMQWFIYHIRTHLRAILKSLAFMSLTNLYYTFACVLPPAYIYIWAIYSLTFVPNALSHMCVCKRFRGWCAKWNFAAVKN